MFCWGSTVHGELGLGGIEDETILVPRKVDFSRATAIECSKILYFEFFNILFLIISNIKYF